MLYTMIWDGSLSAGGKSWAWLHIASPSQKKCKGAIQNEKINRFGACSADDALRLLCCS